MTEPRIPAPKGLDPEAWRMIGAERIDDAWHVPERDADGKVIGTAIRTDSDRKYMAPGSRRGLTMRHPLHPDAGSNEAEPVLVVEGATDTAAGHMLDFEVVGRPSAGAGLALLQQLLRDRFVVVVGENDASGRRGAEKIAAGLAETAAGVRVVYPPGPAKDLCDWVTGPSRTSRDEVLAAIRAADWYTAEAVWPDLHPFSEPLDAPFPLDALPPTLRAWVEAEAEATQTPAAMPALLAISVVAAAIARRVTVTPRQGWTEPTNIFAAVLMEPASRKSAVFRDATDPLRALESELIEECRPLVERARAEREIDEARKKKLQKTAGETGDEDVRREAAELAVKLSEEPVPGLPCLIADNATPEKLETMLAEQGGRLASMSPEGGVFDIMAGRYSDGAASFDVYLRGHAGDDLRTHRLSREAVLVENPALTCAYAVQPAVIANLAGKPAFRGRGLLGRFLYAVPENTVGRRKTRPAPMPGHVERQYANLVEKLGRREHEMSLVLSADAESQFDAWMTEVEAMLDVGSRMEAMRDWGGKLVGLTARLAAILHMACDAESETIDASSMRSAITIARWSIPHAEAALALMTASNPATAGAGHVWDWVRRHGVDEFTARDVHQAIRRRFTERRELDEALNVLVERGYVRRIDCDGNRPGPRSQQFEVRPELRCNRTEWRTQDSQNPQTAGAAGGLEDFVYRVEAEGEQGFEAGEEVLV